MSLHTPSRKSIVALALVVPLALTACGSGKDKNASTSAAATTTKVTTSAAAAPATSAPAAESSAATEPTADAQAAPQTLVNPFENGANPLTAQPLAPVEGGQPADEALKGTLTSLVGGIYQQQDFRAFTRYIPENSCAALLDAQEADLRSIDYNQVPVIPMSDIMGADWGKTGLDSLSDVSVNGNDASALVTVNTPEGQQTSTMRFRNENGRWTFCNG